MKVISKTGEKCLLVVDDNMKLLGTLSDGDLRRGILKGKDFDTVVENFYNREPKVLMSGNFTKTEAGEILVKERIDLLPILNSENTVLDYITISQVFGNKTKKYKKSLNLKYKIGFGFWGYYQCRSTNGF